MRKIFAAVILTAFSVSASAVPVEWTFSDVVYNDGSVTEGSFKYDADTFLFSDLNIVTTCGSVCNGVLIQEGFFGATLGTGSVVSLAIATHDESFAYIRNDISFITPFGNWVMPLTNAGGTVELSNVLIRDKNGGGAVVLEGATVSAVPIPAAAWLFGSGLGLLGWMRRKA